MKTVVVVPFVAVPHFETFRFKGKYWQRKPQTVNYAVCVQNKSIHQVIEENVAVGILKEKLREKDYHYIIKELFDK